MKNSVIKFSVVFGVIGAILILTAQFIYLSRMIEANQMSDEEFQIKINDGIKAFVAAEMEKQDPKVPETPPRSLSKEEMEQLMDDDAIRGSIDAPVTIIEFSDYECPYCSMYVEEAYREIKEKYVDTGIVKYVFRDFPLSFHQNAMGAHIAAQCAFKLKDDEAYFFMHDKIFLNQDSLNYESYEAYAGELGISADDFKVCYDSDDMMEEIIKDINDAQAVGVSGTPSFFINGEFVAGALPFSAFEEIIESKLSN